MRRVIVTALALSAASLLAQAKIDPNTAPPLPPFAHVDPRIAEYNTQQRAGTAVRGIGVVELSPDGRQLVWGVANAPGRTGGTLHISNAASPSPDDVAINAGDGCNISTARWSPDNATLAYVASCADRQPQLWLRDRAGAARQLTHITGTMTSPEWAPDGKSIAFLYVENASRAAGATAAQKMPSGVVGEDGVEVQWVASADVATGNISIITPKTLHAFEFDWAPDSKHLAFVAAPPRGENNWWVAQLYTVAPGSPDAAKSILNPMSVSGPLHGLQIAVPRYSPDGRNIALIGGLMSDQGSTGGDVYLLGADGSGLQDLTPGIKSTPVYLAWADDAHLVVSEYQSGKTHIGILGTNGKELMSAWTEQTAIGSGRAASSFSFSRSARLVAFTAAGPGHAAELYEGGVTGIKAVSHLNEKASAGASKTVSMEWDNAPYHVQGWLTLPENYDPGKKYPMIVSVHGGPASQTGPFFGSGGGGLWAHLGYFFFQANPRGSYGQGEAFVQANRKDFGYGDLADILTGIDAVEKQYSVDDNRIGITGGSYGGFMSMFAPTQTRRFRASVAFAGISNWQSYYGENTIDQWMVPYFGASVYDDPAPYAKSSAINFIKNVTAPMLIQVGDRDGECPPAQSYEMWHALRALNKKTQLVIYPNEGHGLSDPGHNADRIARTVAWFEVYLK